MNKRIDSIDGWRAIACLGVLYTHIWATLKFPALKIGPIDLMQLLNLWGNGVHLFYVISGLCFYLVMNKQKSINLSTSLRFIKKRWLRIAPAFYTAAIVYGIYYFSQDISGLINKLIVNFLFIQSYIKNGEISAIFWSLDVEWHFYLLIPVIFYFIRKWSLIKVTCTIIGIEIFLSLLHYKGYLMAGSYEIWWLWWYSIVSNLQYFCCGIITGFFFMNSEKAPRIFRSWLGLPMGLIIAYAGKVMFSSAVVSKAGSAGFIFEALGPLVMTIGFSCMILTSLLNNGVFNIIGNKPMVFIGRISFSMYIWHSLILDLVHRYLGSYIPNTVLGLVAFLVIALVILLPLAMVSYHFLESFYFKKQAVEKVSYS